MLQLKTQRPRCQRMLGFFNDFNFGRNCDVWKSKSPCFLLNKKVKSSKHEMKAKIENPTRGLRDKTLSFSSRTSRKQRECTFCTFILSQGNVYSVCILSKCMEFWINSFIVYALHTLLAFKITKSLQCILKHNVNVGKLVEKI